ncbi:AaceriADL142Cp [[Ashbya] aceris (nom. inval.)]|nr:AaceriADL142Cp [[Ashbya] aceris (nom. inval.)]
MGDYALHEACMNGEYARAVQLLSDNPGLVRSKDADSRYPLHWAVSYQHVKIVELLLSYMLQVDLDTLVDDAIWSPVHVAAAVGNREVLGKLLAHSVQPSLDATTSQGTTALHLACSKQHYGLVEDLLAHGASVRKKDKKQQLPLHRACAIGSAKLVKLLCDARSPVNSKDANGWPPLFHALSEGHADIALLLVNDYGAEWESVESAAGETALQVAVDDNVRDYFVKNIT